MRTQLLFAAASLLVLSSTAHAGQPSYDFVQTSLLQSEFADISPFTLQGFEVKVSKELGYKVFAEATYFAADDTLSGDTFDVSDMKLTVGYIQRLSNKTAIDYQFGYGDINLKLSNANALWKDSTHFFVAETNIRHKFTPALEAFGGLEWQFWGKGSDQKAYNVGVQYDWAVVAVGAKYTKYSDSDRIGMFVRYEF